jgi:2-oxoglutarate ferredoxin oxidoreductase subunit gamma
MTERLIIAGEGGQGIMLLGKIIAMAALAEGREVSWLPAYGAEVRGGTAYCMVIISDHKIASPFIEKADTLIIMNKPSLVKFKEKIDKAGLVIINSSLAKPRDSSLAKVGAGIVKVYGPFTELAVRLGNIKVANMVALGAYLAKKKIISRATLEKVIEEIAPAQKKNLIAVNRQALFAGMEVEK